MPPASWPSAVSFSDWWSWLSTSRCTVVSRTMAMSPSSAPWRPRSPESVTASAGGPTTSNASMGAPSTSLRRAAPYSAAGRKSVTGRPSASALARPNTRSAAGFQPSIRSAVVTDTMASPAEAMSCSSECLVSAISPYSRLLRSATARNSESISSSSRSRGSTGRPEGRLSATRWPSRPCASRMTHAITHAASAALTAGASGAILTTS